ncbi:MAG: hypothetical protein ABSE82_16765 [Nitrososphaerales archaeon]|jgi:hypothetical protein
MSETNELREAEGLIAQGMEAKAQPILWRLFESKNSEIALQAGLFLLAALDHVTQGELLLQITDRCIATASALGRKDIYVFLLVQKAKFLLRELSDLLYRRQCLKLAANVFEWIDFSLREDEAEYRAITGKMKGLNQESADLVTRALGEAKSNPDHYFQGKVSMELGEVGFSRYMLDLGLLMEGGPWKSKIHNIYFVRRWNLDKFISYDRKARQMLRESFRNALLFQKRAMEEFIAGGHRSEAGHAAYALALHHTFIFRFSKANRYLKLATTMANPQRDVNLLSRIAKLGKMLKDGCRHPRNWVEEMGLDLPRALRPRVPTRPRP